MKKTSFLAILLALTLLLCQFSFPLSMAVAELERCDAGDHDYELIDVNDYGMGMPVPFSVNSCENVSFSHMHYYIPGYRVLTYACNYCGERKVVEHEYIVPEYSDCCAYNNAGK